MRVVPPNDLQRRAPIRRSNQRGYVLLLVIASLTAIAWVAGIFATRIDALRTQALSLIEDSQSQVQARSAMAAGLYWVSTRQVGIGGFGDDRAVPAVWADGRTYSLPNGGTMDLQDERGLLSLYEPERMMLSRFLRAMRVPQSDVDSFVDVLLDYQDADSLVRLNGAEAPQYAQLGLMPPANEWLRSTSELVLMPRWRDDPGLLASLVTQLSVNRQAKLNPNVAPMAVIRAHLPWATPEQLGVFETIRKQVPFQSLAHLKAATGISLDDERYVAHVSNELRIRAFGARAHRGLQYNLTLTPGGLEAPWQVATTQWVVRTPPTEAPLDSATPFPLAILDLASRTVAPPGGDAPLAAMPPTRRASGR